MKPKRIQLSRKKGFNLQEASQKLNGLPAVNVSRPTRWGNPFKIGKRYYDYLATNGVCIIRDHEDVIESFKVYLFNSPSLVEAIKRELTGKNLACWCPMNQACHADILLDIANEKPSSGPLK